MTAEQLRRDNYAAELAESIWVGRHASESGRKWAKSAWDDMGGSEPSAERAHFEMAVEVAISPLLERLKAVLTAEPTKAERVARWTVESTHHFHGTTCLCDFDSPVSRQRTEHITGALMEALRAARSLT